MQTKSFYKIVICLLIIAGIFLKFYNHQKKENNALKIKIALSNNVKEAAIPWSRLETKTITGRDQKTTKETTKQKNVPIIPLTTTSSVVFSTVAPAPMSDQSTEQLVETVTQNMAKIKDLDLRAIDNNIEMAEEIISREPNAYSAYKAKLISMIVKESKLNQNIDEYDLNQVLEKMAGLDVGSDQMARKEAALMANTNNQLMKIENDLNDLAMTKDEISLQSSALDKDSPEYQELQVQDERLGEREQTLAENLENLQNAINNEKLPSLNVNEDIVEIPFLRLLAQSDYETVRDNAQSFIQQFPSSLIGYFYLIKALELQGKTDEAIAVIADSTLSPEDQKILQERLDASSGDDLKKYWEKLRF